jgi:hypothetical protein
MCKPFEVKPCSLFGIGHCLTLLRACAFGTGLPSHRVNDAKVVSDILAPSHL